MLDGSIRPRPVSSLNSTCNYRAARYSCNPRAAVWLAVGAITTIGKKARAIRRDLLNVDLLEFRRRPFFSGLLDDFDNFIHVRPPLGDLRGGIV